MAKIAITIAVLRVLQLVAGIAFAAFWIWSCAAGFVVGGGPGEYAFGFITVVASHIVAVYGAWSFKRKLHLQKRQALHLHAAWLVDLILVGLWLGVILVNILVPIDPQEWSKQLGGAPAPDGGVTQINSSNSILIVGDAVSLTQLLNVIMFFMTALLLFITALRPDTSAGTSKENVERADGRQEVGEA